MSLLMLHMCLNHANYFQNSDTCQYLPGNDRGPDSRTASSYSQLNQDLNHGTVWMSEIIECFSGSIRQLNPCYTEYKTMLLRFQAFSQLWSEWQLLVKNSGHTSEQLPLWSCKECCKLRLLRKKLSFLLINMCWIMFRVSNTSRQHGEELNEITEQDTGPILAQFACVSQTAGTAQINWPGTGCSRLAAQAA